MVLLNKTHILHVLYSSCEEIGYTFTRGVGLQVLTNPSLSWIFVGDKERTEQRDGFTLFTSHTGRTKIPVILSS